MGLLRSCTDAMSPHSRCGVVRELIIAVDDEARRLAYAVVEGLSRLVWITDVLPHELAAEVRMHVERGAAVMKQTMEEEAGQG